MRRSDQESHVRSSETVAEECRTAQIRRLNDQLRRQLSGGRVMVTSGVQELGSATIQRIVAAVRQHEDFAQANDPYQEHDFGALTVNDHEVFWKIDYYDNQLEFGSSDPANPAVTTRVITIMLACEY